MVYGKSKQTILSEFLATILLGAMTVVMIGGALFIFFSFSVVGAAKQDRRLEDFVLSHGGSVVRRTESVDQAKSALNPIVGVDFENCDIDDSVVERTCQLINTDIVWLNFNNNPRVTDKSVAYLDKQSQLDRISIAGTSITRDGVEELRLFRGDHPDVEFEISPVETGKTDSMPTSEEVLATDELAPSIE